MLQHSMAGKWPWALGESMVAGQMAFQTNASAFNGRKVAMEKSW